MNRIDLCILTIFFYGTTIFAENSEIDVDNEFRPDQSEVNEIATEHQSYFEDDQTYILTKKFENHSPIIFYWSGKSASLDKKRETAASVARLWNNLVDKRRTSSEGPIISREVQGKESEFFKKYFSHCILNSQEHQKTEIIRNLYMIKLKKQNISIELVEPNLKKIHYKISYVLDTGKNLYICHGSNVVDEVRSAAKELGKRILKDEYPVNEKPSEDELGVEEILPKKFLELFENTEEHKNLLCKINDKIKSYVQLFEVVYAKYDHIELIQLTKGKRPIMKMLKACTCYILINAKFGYLYLVIGKWSSLDKVEYVLEKGEEFVLKSDKWKKVIVVTENRTPATFLAHFYNFGNGNIFQGKE